MLTRTMLILLTAFLLFLLIVCVPATFVDLKVDPSSRAQIFNNIDKLGVCLPYAAPAHEVSQQFFSELKRMGYQNLEFIRSEQHIKTSRGEMKVLLYSPSNPDISRFFIRQKRAIKESLPAIARKLQLDAIITAGDMCYTKSFLSKNKGGAPTISRHRFVDICFYRIIDEQTVFAVHRGGEYTLETVYVKPLGQNEYQFQYIDDPGEYGKFLTDLLSTLRTGEYYGWRLKGM